MRICCKCGVLQDESEFYFREDRQAYTDCKSCNRTRAKLYKQLHYDKVRIKKMEWRKANREKHKASCKKFNNVHRDELAIRHKEYVRINMDSAVERTRRHRAKKKGATIRDFTLSDWEGLLFTYDHRCAYCRKDEQEVGQLCQDHVIPLFRGGNHTLDNIVPACRKCNSSKGIKLLSEWIN